MRNKFPAEGFQEIIRLASSEKHGNKRNSTKLVDSNRFIPQLSILDLVLKKKQANEANQMLTNSRTFPRGKGPTIEEMVPAVQQRIKLLQEQAKLAQEQKEVEK
eukprot:g43975.t1